RFGLSRPPFGTERRSRAISGDGLHLAGPTVSPARRRSSVAPLNRSGIALALHPAIEGGRMSSSKLARAHSGALMGVDAVVVEAEVEMSIGLPYFNVVGLPEGAVKESKVRVISALRNAGYDLPQKRITVNLAPADIRKEGAAFEL